VTTPSRLHFSMVDLRGDLGRIFGSVGVAIDRPKIVLKARQADGLNVSGSRADRVRSYAEAILQSTGLEGGADIEVSCDIPEHAGFGSGTQLALAVGAAFSELYDLGLSTEEVALRLNRSRRSGVGTYAFDQGGFIVDGGHRVDSREGIPPLVFRADVPEGWRFVAGVPDIPNYHHGRVEEEAFKRLGPPPAALIGEISRIVLLKMIPAVLEADIEAFGEAMTGVDYKFGSFWKEVQGGVFSHPTIEAGIEFLMKEGALGVGQSSWGPAFYGLTDSAGGSRLSSSLEAFLNEGGRRGTSFVARPDNDGALIKVE